MLDTEQTANGHLCACPWKMQGILENFVIFKELTKIPKKVVRHFHENFVPEKWKKISQENVDNLFCGPRVGKVENRWFIGMWASEVESLPPQNEHFYDWTWAMLRSTRQHEQQINKLLQGSRPDH